MAVPLSKEEFDRTMLEADLRRQARQVRETQAQSAQLAAESAQALQASGTGTLPSDPRNLPSTSQGEFVTPATVEQSRFLRKAERPGVPLDIETGAPAGLRAAATFVPEDPQAQVAFWKGKLGNQKVDFIDGRYILRDVPDKSGTTRDLVVDEERLSAKDLVDGLREAPEFIASVLASTPSPAAAPTRMAQLLNLVVKPSLAGATTFQGVKLLKESAARLSLDVPGDVNRTLRNSAEQGAWDAFLGMTLGATPIVGAATKVAARNTLVKGAEAGTKALESSGRGMITAEGQLGREFLARETPIDIPVSAGQLTGFAPLIRFEAISEKIPFIRNWIAKSRAAQSANEQALQRWLVPGEPSSERLGGFLIKGLREPVQRAETELSEMRKLLGDEQSAKLVQAFALSAPERTGYQAAKGLWGDMGSKYDTWRAENSTLYKNVYDIPAAQERAIPTKGIMERLKSVVLDRQGKREVPRDFTAEEIAAGRPSISPQDTPTMPGAEISGVGALEEVPIPGTLPPGIAGLAAKVQDFGPQAKLQELVDLRSQINQAIQNPDILPGVDDYMRKQISNSITEAIQDYTGRVENTNLKDALTRANTHYKEKVELWESPGVRQLLLPQEGRFAVNLDEYSDTIFRGGKGAVARYERVKNLLGPDAPSVQVFREHFLQRVAKPYLNTTTRSLDFDGLANAVRDIPKEIADDLFPNSRQAIIDASRAGQFAKQKLSFDEVAPLLASDSLTLGKMQAIRDRQQKLDDILRNRIFQSVKEGKIDDISVQPDVFLDTVIFSDRVPLTQLRDVLDLVAFRNPELSDQIAFKYMSKLFRESADSAAQENITLAALGRPERQLDPAKFAAFFNSPERRERLQAVLGERRYDVLQNFTKHLATRAFAEQTAGGAGGIMATMILTDIMNLKRVSQLVQMGTIAALLSDNKLLRLITTMPPPGVEPSKWSKYLIRSAVVSPEFVTKMSSDLSEEEVDEAGRQLQEATALPTP